MLCTENFPCGSYAIFCVYLRSNSLSVADLLSAEPWSVFTPFRFQAIVVLTIDRHQIPIQNDRVNLQVSEGDKNSVESLRDAINYMSQSKLLAAIYPEENANWLVSKASEVASSVSQLNPGGVVHLHEHLQVSDCMLTHIHSIPAPTKHLNSALSPSMDFLISSGVEKIIQSTIQELRAFEGLEAPLIHQVLQGQKLAQWLNSFLATSKNIIKQDPQFLDDFERNIRKRVLVCIIKEAQKLVDHNLKQ